MESTEIKQKKVKEKSNRFKIDRLQVSDQLDGLILASFNRRLLAFGFDVVLLFLISYFWWLILLALLFMRLIKGKLKNTFKKAKTVIGWQLRSVDNKLTNYQVDEKLKRQFNRNLKIYLYIAMYLPMLVAIVFAISFVSGVFSGLEKESFLLTGITTVANSFSPLDFLISGIVSVLYFGIFNFWFQGQTIGKKIMGIRVMKLNGKSMTFWGSIERATGYAASGSLFFYGFFQFFWDPNRQTTHDKITETIVIRDN